MRSSRTSDDRRSGVAASELAVCLPVLMIVVIGMLEACTMIFLKQSLTIAAYEGARKAIGQNATNTAVLNTVNQILSDRRVKAPSITLSPSDVSTALPGTYIAVRIAAPCNSNNVVSGWFFRGKQMQAEVQMMKEF